MSVHENASITTLKKTSDMHDADYVGTNNDAAPKRKERDEGDVQKVLSVITSGTLTNPVSFGEIANDAHEISTDQCTTGLILPPDIVNHFLQSQFRNGLDEVLCGTEPQCQ